MLQCGLCFQNGWEVGIDVAAAGSYFKMPADLGNPLAVSTYGKWLQEGRVVRRDLALAARYYELSAALGDPSGMWLYGNCLEDGRRVPIDVNFTCPYYKASADLGNAYGMSLYGKPLERDRNNALNVDLAARYFRMSAHLGNAQAMYLYGNGPEDGERAWHAPLWAVFGGWPRCFLRHGLGRPLLQTVGRSAELEIKLVCGIEAGGGTVWNQSSSPAGRNAGISPIRSRQSDSSH
jgi:TPR repeat protein